MSHFTHMKTCFRNFAYLEKALSRLKIEYTKEMEFDTPRLRIPQTNGYNIEFAWNGQVYELVVDLSFWEQPYPVESFIDKVAKQYAGAVIIGESHKQGFQPTTSIQNVDGSTTLVLERWNLSK